MPIRSRRSLTTTAKKKMTTFYFYFLVFVISWAIRISLSRFHSFDYFSTDENKKYRQIQLGNTTVYLYWAIVSHFYLLSGPGILCFSFGFLSPDGMAVALKRVCVQHRSVMKAGAINTGTRVSVGVLPFPKSRTCSTHAYRWGASATHLSELWNSAVLRYRTG